MISSSQRLLPVNTQHSQQTYIHARGRIRTHDLSRRAGADLRLRPRDRRLYETLNYASENFITLPALTIGVMSNLFTYLKSSIPRDVERRGLVLGKQLPTYEGLICVVAKALNLANGIRCLCINSS